MMILVKVVVLMLAVSYLEAAAARIVRATEQATEKPVHCQDCYIAKLDKLDKTAAESPCPFQWVPATYNTTGGSVTVMTATCTAPCMLCGSKDDRESKCTQLFTNMTIEDAGVKKDIPVPSGCVCAREDGSRKAVVPTRFEK